MDVPTLAALAIGGAIYGIPMWFIWQESGPIRTPDLNWQSCLRALRAAPEVAWGILKGVGLVFLVVAGVGLLMVAWPVVILLAAWDGSVD